MGEKRESVLLQSICAKNKRRVGSYSSRVLAVFFSKPIFWYSGLGDFLNTLDPRREWQEHLQHILIFCKTHVQRNFKKKFGDHEAKYRLHLIWEAPSKEDVISQLDSLASVFPEISKWIKNKKSPGYYLG